MSANELASNGKRYKVGSLPGSSAPFCWGKVVGMAMPLLVALLHAVQSQHAGLASSPCPAAQPACAQLLVLASNARRAKASCAELCNSLPIAHWAIMLSERVQDVPVQTTLVTCKSVPFNCSLQWAIVFFERVEDAQAAKRDLDRQVRFRAVLCTTSYHTPRKARGRNGPWFEGDAAQPFEAPPVTNCSGSLLPGLGQVIHILIRLSAIQHPLSYHFHCSRCRASAMA